MCSCFQLDKGGCELIQESSQQFWQFDVNAQPWPNSHQLIPGLLFWSQCCHYHPHHKNMFKMLLIFGQAFWLLLWITLVHQRRNAETLYLNLSPLNVRFKFMSRNSQRQGLRWGGGCQRQGGWYREQFCPAEIFADGVIPPWPLFAFELGDTHCVSKLFSCGSGS